MVPGPVASAPSKRGKPSKPERAERADHAVTAKGLAGEGRGVHRVEARELALVGLGEDVGEYVGRDLRGIEVDRADLRGPPTSPLTLMSCLRK